MKSVLFLIPSLGGGGAERVLCNLVNNLDVTKYQVSVQTLFDVGTNRKYLNKDIVYIPGFKKQISGNVIFLKLFSPQFLYKKLIKKKYDIVVSYLEGPTARIVSGCPHSDTKIICWIHVEQKTRQAATYAFRSFAECQKCYQRYNQIVCVADSVKKDFESIFPVAGETVVLYNTNEDEMILEKSKEKVQNRVFSEQKNIISIGRLVKAKGYDRLIKVHKRLIENGIQHQVYILGNGNMEAQLKDMIREYHIEETFHLLKFQENPYKYIASADLFVCSSRREGFSTAVTESLIVGTPVVSTSCSGACELLGYHNEFGIVTENSEDGIYDGMYKMLTEPGLLEYYQKQARERGKMFSKDKTVKEVEALFDNM